MHAHSKVWFCRGLECGDQMASQYKLQNDNKIDFFCILDNRRIIRMGSINPAFGLAFPEGCPPYGLLAAVKLLHIENIRAHVDPKMKRLDPVSLRINETYAR